MELSFFLSEMAIPIGLGFWSLNLLFPLGGLDFRILPLAGLYAVWISFCGWFLVMQAPSRFHSYQTFEDQFPWLLGFLLGGILRWFRAFMKSQKDVIIFKSKSEKKDFL